MSTLKNGMSKRSLSTRQRGLDQTKASPGFSSISLKTRAQMYFGSREFAGEQSVVSEFARFRHLSTSRRQRLEHAILSYTGSNCPYNSWSTHDLFVFQAALSTGDKSLAFELANLIHNELLRCVSELEDDGVCVG